MAAISVTDRRYGWRNPYHSTSVNPSARAAIRSFLSRQMK
jgi:hypothetical protein